MLSPGRFHEKVPRGMPANLLARKRLLLEAEKNLLMQRLLWERCRDDLLWYVNLFVWQFNPNAHGSEVRPFISWPEFQDEAFKEILYCIDTGKDLVIEKSREMGASWMCLIVGDWLCRFHRNQSALAISRNAEAVDDAKSSSLFWKLRFINNKLPRWMKVGVKFTSMRVEYARTESEFVGEASTGKAGVGGRFRFIFADEFSQIREAYQVISRTSDSTKCRIFNGTHVGKDSAFAMLARRPDIRKLVLHWTKHPDKNKGLYKATTPVQVLDKQFQFDPDFQFVQDGTPTGGPYPAIRSPWYDGECKRKTSIRAVAEDLDINPEGAASQVFDPLMVRTLQETYCREPVWRGTIVYDRDSGADPELVAAPGGPLKLWINPKVVGGKLMVPRGSYSAGADIATGTGNTPSCLSIGRASGDGAGKKVAEYSNSRIPVDEFAVFCVAMCSLFRDENGTGAKFAWESKGPGVRFGIKVVELGYRNIYMKQNIFDLTAKITMTPGWHPDPKSKRELIESYMACLNNRQFENPSREGLAECLSFIYKPNGSIGHSGEEADDPSAARENHGDMVIADALNCKMMRVLHVEDVPVREDSGEPDIRSLAGRRLLAEHAEKMAQSWGW